MSIFQRTTAKLAVGAPPKAELLPPEVQQGVKAKSLRRTLFATVILAAIVVAAGYAGATVLAVAKQGELDAANKRTSDLLAEQLQYVDARNAKTLIGQIEVGQRLGDSTEITWKKFLQDVEDSLPKGTRVTNVAAVMSTPTLGYAAPTIPLQGARIGELKFAAVSKALPDVDKWLVGLAKLPGFVDAVPTSVIQADGGDYTVAITMHINSDALSPRYVADTEAK